MSDGKEWKILFHSRPHAEGVPVQEISSTPEEAKRKKEALEAKLTDTERAARAHFSVVSSSPDKPSLGTGFRRKTPGLGDRRKR
jgi:hypothetical protein